MDKVLLSKIFRAVWVVLIAVFIVVAAYFIIPLIYPFIIGWLIAYILNPLVNLLQKKAKFPRWLATLTGIFIFLGVTGAFISLLVSKIVVEIGKFSTMVNNNIDFWIEDLIQFINSENLQSIMNQISSFYSENYQTIDQNLNSIGERLSQAVTSIIGLVVGGIITIITSLPNIAFILIIVVLAAFFISKDWHKIIQWISPLFPRKIIDSTRNVWKDFQKAVFGFVRAQLIMISITAMLVIIGLLILGVEYAVTIGLLIGLIDLLPYLGTGAAMIPWIIYLFIQGDVSLGIGISILYGVIFVARSTIEPKVLATSIGLNALATLIAMVVGLNLFGIAGIIIGPVSLILILAAHRADVFRDIRKYIIDG